MMRAEWDPEQVQTSGQTEYQASVEWLERVTTVQVPAGHAFATWPSSDKKLGYAIRAMITAAARGI